VPATGYQFVNWTGTGGFVTSTANPLTVSNVTAAQTITANFTAIVPAQYTVTFAAGANGSLTGTASQTVNSGASTTAVTAVPATGYQFVNWTGTGGFVTSTANPLTVSNVTANQAITANFAQAAVPITTASPVGGTYSNSVTVTLSTTQGGTIYYTIDGTTPTTASPAYTGSITLAPTATQSYTVKYFAVSQSGTVETVKSTAYTVHVSDLIGSIQINSGAAYTKGTAVTLTLSATDPQGVASMQFSNDGTTYSTPETYATSKSWTLASGDGLKTVYVKYIDTLGTAYPAYTAQITLDTVVPTTTATPPPGVYAGSVSVALTASEPGTIYYTTDGTQPSSTSKVYTGPIPLTSPVTGTMTLKFFSVDRAGNAETPQSLVYTIHQTDLSGAAVVINGGVGFTKSRNVTLALSATDPDGVTQMQVACDGSTYAAVEPFATTKSCVLSAGDGLKTVSVKFMDGLGVWYPAISGQITLDTTPPVTSITPAAGTYDGTVKVTLSPNETATIYYTTDGTTPTTASPVYSGPITLSATTTTQTFNVQYFAVDQAGNAETVKNAAYIIHVSDMVGSITINNGASYTTSTAVTLTLSATDPQGVTSMQFSNDGSSYSALEPYATSKAWTLNGGDGLKTVYVRFKDGAGELYTFPASITLATAAAGSLPGDLNGDGKVDIADALRALQISVGMFQPTTAELVRGDVAPMASGKPAPDGVIDTADALVILKLSLGLISW
ncbi:MAG TPA: chitobiase/beta-hexosaminidase C-terminal domain-containing protein, partial [Desulfuromonadaceae bacterium]